MKGSHLDSFWLLKGTPGSATFDTKMKIWHFSDGSEKSFGQLIPKTSKRRYPRLSGDLLCSLLESKNNFVGKKEWDLDYGGDPSRGKTPMRAVICEIWKAFRLGLGYEGRKPFEAKRDGYQLLPGYFERSSMLTRGGMTRLPLLRWSKELIELVREGKSTHVTILPGNGAEQVYEILVHNVTEARVVELDLATIRETELLGEIADNSEDPPELWTADGRPNYLRIARSLAGQGGLLAVVVQGWGAFDKKHPLESREKVAQVLHGFMKVRDPKVAIVLVSPTPIYHQLTAHLAGSLLPLQPVFPSNDCEDLENWARTQLSSLSQEEVTELLTAARGQLGAVLAAVNAAERNQKERLLSVRQAHISAGQNILGAVGSCCYETLLGKSSACIKDLDQILIKRKRGFEPRIKEWATSWTESRINR